MHCGWSNGILCSLAINDVIKENNLVGQELEVILRPKRVKK